MRSRLGRPQASPALPSPSAEFQRALCAHFCAQDTAAIEHAMAGYAPGMRLTVAFDSAAVQSPMSCAWSCSPSQGVGFTFPVFQKGEVLSTAVSRWLALWELFQYLGRPGGPSGRVIFNLNDVGLEPGLAFSGDRPEYVLIPDSDFFRSHGYAPARKYFAGHPTPWEERCPAVFWRGSSLGQKEQAILEMPRARLCQIAKTAPNDWFDVGIADVFHVSEQDAAQLRAANLIKARVPWKHLLRYRFHIDIDGHANSYAGLFRKLLSGGPGPESCFAPSLPPMVL